MAALRAVGDDEKPPKPLTIIAAVIAGDRLAELEATHRRIALAVQNESTPPRDLASLTRRQLEISKEVEGLRRQQEVAEEDADTADEGWSEAAI